MDLGAKEVVGIDKDHDSINQAIITIKYFQEDVEILRRNLTFFSRDIDRETLVRLGNWVTEYGSLVVPSFIVADAVSGTELPPDHFDLAYCERFLYHIACRDDPKALEETRAVIHEMARIVKPGGVIVAIEPNTCSPADNTPVQLDPIFQDAGLTKSNNGNGKFSDEAKTLYLYFKPENLRV